MKIIQIITLGHQLYGAQKHVLDLSIELQKDKHDVLVIVGSKGLLTDQLKKEQIRYVCIKSLVREISPINDARAVFAIKNEIKKFSPDIVATHSSKAGIIGRLAARLANTPCTFTAHGWSFEEGIPYARRKLFLNIEKFTARISDRIITVAELERNYGLDCAVAPPEKLHTIYYGVNDRQSVKEKDNTENSTPVLTMVAGIRPQKDHHTLIEALAQLKQLKWKLYLLGDGPLTEKVKTQVKEYGLEDRVCFEGMVDNVPKYLVETDILVLITHWEGLPISILEGLAYSLPVIATDVAGVKEEVIDGYNGITVPPKDVVAVRDSIKQLLENTGLRTEYGNNSRKLFLKEFTMEAMYKKTIKLYREIVNEKK